MYVKCLVKHAASWSWSTFFVALLPRTFRAARAAAPRPWCVVPVAFSKRSNVYLATRAMPESTSASCIMALEDEPGNLLDGGHVDDASASAHHS